ncbi:MULTISPECIES: heme biosynthesis HemY N-terminal domain-containing protein [Thiomicrorhabdus]|uniref:Heme biosynthesis protein HemY n=1 Tax=Thiomicrorhabdus heinhorstiae TaxID=2748010 RepID=A0ABS0BYV0_9GAMM|nr:MULTISPECIES: heme biosynthesis HemY N-terminal domain-containing protein [Thiomicrorhabdus]MBF6058968.1 heme biosynthesis protein HemY [Thiomicrorhabdus heinhorstiae]
MKQIVIWALVLVAGTLLTSLMLYDNGQVSMAWNNWVIETSLSFLIAAVVIGFIGGYALIRLLWNLWRFPKFWRNRRRMRRYSKAESTMAEGMIALEYGDWQKAEKYLIKSAKQSEAGLVHYLSAAKMAHNQGADARRDNYLLQAREQYPEDYVTIGLVESRLLSEKSPQLALGVLDGLYSENPNHPTVLAELVAVLKQLAQWQRIRDLMPLLKKHKVLQKEQLVALEKELWAGQLAVAADEETLDRLWQALSPKQKLMPEILAEYVERCLGWGQEVGLAQWLEQALKKQWDDRLVYQYGRLTLGPAFDRLKTSEKWLKGRESNPILLLTLGRLACQSQLWGLGQSYLKQSLRLEPQVETFHALAQCYESEGQESQAALTYKEAILQLEKKA